MFDERVENIEVNPFKPNLIGVGGGQEALIVNLEGDLT